MEEQSCTVIFEMDRELCRLTQNASVAEILDHFGGAQCLEIRFSDSGKAGAPVPQLQAGGLP